MNTVIQLVTSHGVLEVRKVQKFCKHCGSDQFSCVELSSYGLGTVSIYGSMARMLWEGLDGVPAPTCR